MGSRVRRDATRTPVGSGLREEGTGVHVTATACEALSKLLERRATPDRCLRLSTNQGNYRFIIDEPIEHDIVYNFEGRVVRRPRPSPATSGASPWTQRRKLTASSSSSARRRPASR